MSDCILQWIRALCQVDNWTPGFYGLICWGAVGRGGSYVYNNS